VRVIARFDGYRGKYAFHCHNLEHEDMMMMANFKVI
jgi:spore coat protein A